MSLQDPGMRPGQWETAGDHERRVRALEANQSGGGGIQFDVDNQGGWLDITVNDLDNGAIAGSRGFRLVDTTAALAGLSFGGIALQSIGDPAGAAASFPGFVLLEAGTYSATYQGAPGNIEIAAYLDTRTNYSSGDINLYADDEIGLYTMTSADGSGDIGLYAIRDIGLYSTRDGAIYSDRDIYIEAGLDDGGDIHIEARAGGYTVGNVWIEADAEVIVRLQVAGGTFTVTDNGTPIFRVDKDGDLHGLTGKALTFDL